MTAAEDTISLCILRLRKKVPFFGALALFLRHALDERVPTACTDGMEVRFNPDFVDSLTPEELDAVMVHELLHAALLHVPRLGDREPLLWNVAADIVVNGMIRLEKNLSLPLEPCIDPNLENLEVEEVYEILRTRAQPPPISWIGTDLDPDVESGDGAEDRAHRAVQSQTHWKQALQQAATVTAALGHGLLPAGIRRHIDRISDPELDWRSLLWRFLVRTPVDYMGFDHRLIGRGIYLETLGGESVTARVAVDTSGSITEEQLVKFLAEVCEILRLYPQIDLKLYYADAALHGPFDPQDEGFAQPVGNGGTSFVPFFELMRDELDPASCSVLVYLTDGYGAFPETAPDLPVLWVVTPGGLASNRFPFGTVTRFL